MMTEMATPTVNRGRLRWQCRRALLELDLVFEHFLAHHFDTLSEAELATLAELLTLEDYDLWALVNGSRLAPVAHWQPMLARLAEPLVRK